MPLQTTGSDESSVTHTTFEWFVIGMSSHVIFEVFRLMETLATLVALVRLLAGVSPLVSVEVTRSSEGLVALVAGVRPLPCVDALVNAEVTTFYRTHRHIHRKRRVAPLCGFACGRRGHQIARRFCRIRCRRMASHLCGSESEL